MNKNLIKLKNILISSEYDNRVIKNKKELVHLLKTDYSQFFISRKQSFQQRYFMLFRGIKNNEDIFITKPNNRKSLNFSNKQKTINFYTELFSSVLPSWSKYPKRNHSIICANYSSGLDYYGTQYFIFPKNDTLVATCNYDDFWNAFQDLNLFDDLPQFESIIKELMEVIGYNIDFYKNEKDVLMFFKYFKNRYELVEDYLGNGDNSSKLYKLMLENKDNLLSFFDNLFNPKDNNIVLFDIKDFDTISKKSREFWFDDECICIKYNQEYLDMLLSIADEN
jgi:hypothetical protein